MLSVVSCRLSVGKWIFTFLFFSILLSSCIRFTYREYRRILPGVYFKLHVLGDDTIRPFEGDLITVNLSYSTLEDSVFFRGARKIRLEDPGFQNSVYNCFIRLHEGDSASFIFRSTDFFVKNLNIPVPAFLEHHKRIKMNVIILEVQTNDEFEAEKEQFLKWSESMELAEKDIIRNFLEKEKITVDATPSGMYFILTKAGSGKRPLKGDIVRINYEGKFMNGRYFDSTKKQDEALEFIYGQEFMVIKGIEEAIGMMREGDRALVILPSNLAFGSSGAGDGIIPPFTALIYELELLKVL